VDLQELSQFLQRGKRTPEEEEKKAAERIQRIQNYLKVAFDRLLRKYPTELDIRRMFQVFDKDGEGKLSYNEFEKFVRAELNLSTSDVSIPDLKAFYCKLDLDGDGLEIEEFLIHISKEKNESKGVMSGSSLYVSPSNSHQHRVRKPTYRKILERNCSSSYRMKISESSPSLPQLTPFIGLGRERPPATRLHASSATALGPRLPPL
jgi:hypothetical protein